MTEINILKTERGVTIDWRTNDKRIPPTPIPQELVEQVNTILDYAESLKTPEEKALEQALEYISKKATVEEKAQLDKLFPTKKAPKDTAWFEPTLEKCYSKNDKVLFKDKNYKSKIDDNVWSPESYPAAWEEII